MTDNRNETYFDDNAQDDETFFEFRQRMIDRANTEDMGILSYTVEGQEYPADYDFETDPQGVKDATGAQCKFRKVDEGNNQ